MAKKPGFYDLVKLLSNQNTFSFLMDLNPSANPSELSGAGQNLEDVSGLFRSL